MGRPVHVSTDYDWRHPETSVRPFHVYLMPAHERRGAYWSYIWDAQRFATREEAVEEAKRSLTTSWDRVDLVPFDADSVESHPFGRIRRPKTGFGRPVRTDQQEEIRPT
jgi:hypothetical protein